MSPPVVSAAALLLALASAVPCRADVYPVSGQVQLSFNSQVQMSTRVVAPGAEFQLWISVDIPVDPAHPDLGIVGVEGGVTLPPELEFVQIAFEAPAINVGATFREPGLETFVVGLGQCIGLGQRTVVGVMTLRLVEDASDVAIAVTAPSVGAAAVSSFAGIGPGWARRDCQASSELELVLFDTPDPSAASIVVNPTSVPTEPGSFTLLKSRFGR